MPVANTPSPNMQQSVDDVRRFWEDNPLWSGEASHPVGSRDYFEEHRRIVIDDCLAGRFDERVVPAPDRRRRVLDLGCGPGFWTVELARRGCHSVVAADLTEQALELCRRRCELYGVQAEFQRENAERLSFPDGSFSHVNCQGVIHHTPDTKSCVREIARVLEPGGTAGISVYYKNVILRGWPAFRWPARLLGRLGAKLSGRGRENIYNLPDAAEIVRRYDGAENPIGKSYSRAEFKALLSPEFEINELYLHLFPARTLPFRIPKSVHRLLDRGIGFLIYANVTKC